MFSTLQRQPWFDRASSQARRLFASHRFKPARQRYPASAHPSFASNDSTIVVRSGMMPPLLAGLAAAVLFALALAFFLTPTKSIGYAPDQYAEQQRTRWAGTVRSDSAVRVPIPGEAVARASQKLGHGAPARMPLEPSMGATEPLAPVVVPARAVASVEALEAPLGAPILLATRIGAEQAAVGFSADGDGPLGPARHSPTCSRRSSAGAAARSGRRSGPATAERTGLRRRSGRWQAG
ncbi:MAG: hypothetical protein R3E68_07865 [Burkholderiaceae bacterium]